MRLNNFLNEGIIRVSIRNVVKKLSSSADILKNNVIENLNRILSSENILFKNTEKNDVKTTSIQYAYTTKGGTIVVFINPYIFYDIMKNDGDWFEYFRYDLESIIVHELTHRKQFEKMSSEYLKTKWKDIKITNDKHELMAYANNTVFELINNEEDIWKIMKSLKTGKNVRSETYEVLKNELDKDGWKAYLKYIYMYIDDILNRNK